MSFLKGSDIVDTDTKAIVLERARGEKERNGLFGRRRRNKLVSTYTSPIETLEMSSHIRNHRGFV